MILREDHRLLLVAVNTWYHVGPANETAGKTGFAHLFEHMMFRSSGHVGEDQFWSTWKARAPSFIKDDRFRPHQFHGGRSSNQLEMALWLESDRMGFLLDRINDTSLANQQDVVRNSAGRAWRTRPTSSSRKRCGTTSSRRVTPTTRR